MSEIKMTRKELYDIVWSTPMTKLAKQYSISDNGLRKICKKMDIPLPKAGHWEKLKAGKKVIVEKLSTNYSGNNEIDLTSRSKEYALKYGLPSEMGHLQKEIEEALGSELEIPEKLTKPCELIIEAKRNMEASASSRDLHNGLIDYRRGFSFYVQPANLSRALRFMDTLIKIMLIRGHHVSYVEKDGSKVTWEEAEKAQADLERLAYLMYESYQKDHQLKLQLEKNPKGFPLEKGGSCVLCGCTTSLENSWYDKNGVMCLPCHEAIETEAIPLSAITDKDSWYSRMDLQTYFNLKGSDLRKSVKEGILISSCVLKKNKKINFELFLISENEGVLHLRHLYKVRLKR